MKSQLLMTKEELKQFPKCPGIYLFENQINKKCYVGQAYNLRKRVLQHYSARNYERLKDKPLYKAMDKYGIESFKIFIIETLDPLSDLNFPETLNDLEVYYIKKYDSYNNGYNLTEGAEKTLGCSRNPEIRKKISEKLKLYYQIHKMDFKFMEYTYKSCVAYNFKENFFESSFSRAELARLLNKKYNLKLTSSLISKIISGKQHYTNNFVFGNTKEECLEKLKFFESDNAKHCSINYQDYNEYLEYLEYLKTVVDKNGYLPSLEDIAKHYNKAKTTITGWNNKIREYLELDKYYNRLKLIGFSNKNIDYKLEETKPRYKLYNIKTKEILILNILQISQKFNITIDSVYSLIKRKSNKDILYKEVWKINKYN